MNKSGKNRFATWLAAVGFGILSLAANPALAATPCDIELEQASYINGQTVRLSVFSGVITWIATFSIG